MKYKWDNAALLAVITQKGSIALISAFAPLMAVYKYINIYTVYIICHKS